MKRVALSLCALVTAAFGSGCGRAGSGEAADPARYLEPVIEQLQRKWPENRTVNIVCHGHSVPAGYSRTPVVDSFSAYPHLLHRALKDRYPYAVINVIVTAIGAEASDDGAERFADTVLPHRPDVVLIDYGLNDRSISLDKAAVAWSEMIEAATKQGAHVLLLTPTDDLDASMVDPRDPLNQHAAQIRRLANEHGVGLVDSWTLFKDHVNDGGRREDLLAESNHPNHKGHELVAREILRWFGAAAGS